MRSEVSIASFLLVSSFFVFRNSAAGGLVALGRARVSRGILKWNILLKIPTDTARMMTTTQTGMQRIIASSVTAGNHQAGSLGSLYVI